MTLSDVSEQEKEIREALLARPDHPSLLAALALSRLETGDIGQAVSLLRRASELAPADVNILSDYGATLMAAGRLEEAEANLRMALGIGGGNDDIRFNLARCLKLQHRNDDALEMLVRVSSPQPDMLKLRAALLNESGNWRAAAESYLMALQLQPGDSACLNDLGVLLETQGNPNEFRQLWEAMAAAPDAGAVVHFFLGNALRTAGEFARARDAYRRAIELAPEMSEALNNLALVLNALGEENEAVVVLRQAAELNPHLAAPAANLGAAMSRTPALDDAAAMLEKAVLLDPNCLDARINYGAVLMRQRRNALAEQEFREVLRQRPGDAAAELNLGLLLLSEGRLSEGWPYYESRWKMPVLLEKCPQLTMPRWVGEPLDGKTLFVFSEQGFGDNIQFFRYLPLLRQRYPTVRIVFYALHALVDLFRASPLLEGVEVLPWGQPIPPHDFQIPLLSLPWRCATELPAIPAVIPYLQADPAKARYWQERLAGVPGPRIGLVWASSETFIYRSSKTVALQQLEPLVMLPNCAWVSLQYGKEAGEIVSNGWSGRVLDPMSEIRDFSDTAGLIANLDLVISVDTAVAHLAGALGKPVWMLDRFDTDWRWLPPREDSPWYPGMRIFRQTCHGAWPAVVQRVSNELQAWAAAQFAE